MKKSSSAFTLFELALVVTSISFLMAVILGAENLNNSARAKTILTEIGNFKKITDQFYDKYHFLPGDFPHSDKFYSTRCDSTSSNCNGDGNGLVNYLSTANANAATYSEPLLFWRHLSLEGLIEGNFSGKVISSYGSKTCGSVTSTNWTCCYNAGLSRSCPKSLYNDGYYSFISWPLGVTETAHTTCGTNAGTDYFPQNINLFLLGNFRSSAHPRNGIISGSVAYKIDKKIDDASPTKGLVQTRSGEDYLTSAVGDCLMNSSNVAQSNNASYGTSSLYNYDLTQDKCIIAFIYLNHSSCSLP